MLPPDSATRAIPCALDGVRDDRDEPVRGLTSHRAGTVADVEVDHTRRLSRRREENRGRAHRVLVDGIDDVVGELGAQHLGLSRRLHRDPAQEGGHPVGVGGDDRDVAGAVDDELGGARLAQASGASRP